MGLAAGSGSVADLGVHVVAGRAAQVAACMAVVLALAWLGRGAARRLRQPPVIGEITVGLLAGPVLLRLVGPDTFDVLLPGPVLEALKTVAKVGLALFLVGLLHEMRIGRDVPSHRATGWVAAGALLPPLVAGTLLAGWVMVFGGPAAGLRGAAPAPAFVLFLALALAITAVPVLARILTDRGLLATVPGRLSLAGAVIVDAVGWVLLSVALGLRTGSASGLLTVLAVLVGGLILAYLLRHLLTGRAAVAAGRRFPRAMALPLAAVALAAAFSAERLGLTLPFGAALVGLAVPVGEWAPVIAVVTRVGRLLVQAFFVVTGLTVFTAGLTAVPWLVIVVATVLGTAGKIFGGYAGARLGGQPRDVAARVGVLVNTRGLTELILLQVGYSAKIVTAPLYLALVVTALATTALTGPLLDLLDALDARRARRAAAAVPAGAPG